MGWGMWVLMFLGTAALWAAVLMGSRALFMDGGHTAEHDRRGAPMNHDDTGQRTAPQAGSDQFDRFAAVPFASTPIPPAGQPAQPRRSGWWVQLLMGTPMLAVVAFLVATGAAGGGAIGYALLCTAIVGAMMLFMITARTRATGSDHDPIAR